MLASGSPPSWQRTIEHSSGNVNAFGLRSKVTFACSVQDRRYSGHGTVGAPTASENDARSYAVSTPLRLEITDRKRSAATQEQESCFFAADSDIQWGWLVHHELAKTSKPQFLKASLFLLLKIGSGPDLKHPYMACSKTVVVCVHSTRVCRCPGKMSGFTVQRFCQYSTSAYEFPSAKHTPTGGGRDSSAQRSGG